MYNLIYQGYVKISTNIRNSSIDPELKTIENTIVDS